MKKIIKTMSVTLRSILSYLPSIGLVSKPTFRKNGISAIIPTHNEEWIEPSLRSLKHFVDEIVIVDTSTDSTSGIIKKVAAEEELNLRLIKYEDKSNSIMSRGDILVEKLNIALQNTHHKWICKWHPDFIARTSGESNIVNLREKILNLNDSRYFQIFPFILRLGGDLFHFSHISRNEAHLFTYSPKLVFKDKGKYQLIIVPKFYQSLWIKEIFIFHLSGVKSAEYLLCREFRTAWRELHDYDRFPTLQEYTRYRVEKDWDIKDIKKAAAYNLMKLFKKVIPYDKNKFGEHPEVLKEHLKNPKYKIINKDGTIIGRNDTLQN